MTTRWARFARGWIAAIVSLFVAACSHALSGGAVPATAGLALCLAFSGAVCVLLAGKTLSLPRLSIAVGLSQLLFHGLFSLLTDAPLGTAAPVGAGMHHGSGAMVLQLGSATSAPLSVSATSVSAMSVSAMSVSAMSAHADLRMWIGHAIGAIVTIAALGLGERAFWGLARLTRLCISRILHSIPRLDTSPLPRLRATGDTIVAVPRSLVFSIHRHRGPPALALAL